MPFRSVAFLLYFMGSTAGTMVYPMIGVVCYIVLYHVFPQTTWWGEQLNFLGIRYAFIIGVCLMIGTALHANKLRFGRYAIHPVEGGMILVFVTLLLSGFTGVAWNNYTWDVLDKMAKVFLFAFMLSHVATSRRNIWIVTLVLVLMAWYLGHEAHTAPRGSFEQGRLNGIGGPDFRESSGLAIHLVALLPFIGVALLQRPWWVKAVAFLAGCYTVNAILLCRARSAFLAAVVAGIMAVWYSPRRYRRWVTGMLFLGLAGGMVLSDDWFWQRMVTIFTSAEERDESAHQRLIIWSAAWDMVQERPLGVGIGQFQGQIKRYDPELFQIRRDAHNTFVLCLAETGWIGLFAFLTALLISWFTLRQVQRTAMRHLTNPDFYLLLIFATRLSLIVYLVSGMFVSRFYTEGFWWFLIMPACLARCVENEARDEVAQTVALQKELNRWMQQGRLPETVI